MSCGSGATEESALKIGAHIAVAQALQSGDTSKIDTEAERAVLARAALLNPDYGVGAATVAQNLGVTQGEYTAAAQSLADKGERGAFLGATAAILSVVPVVGPLLSAAVAGHAKAEDKEKQQAGAEASAMLASWNANQGGNVLDTTSFGSWGDLLQGGLNAVLLACSGTR